jgi:Ca2+-binding EF-hand superfamily protein
MKRHLLLCLILLPSAGLAQQDQPQPPSREQINQMFFTEFDEDADGHVSRAEFLRSDNAQFDFMDRNRDGLIDMSEVAAFTGYMMQAPEQQE